MTVFIVISSSDQPNLEAVIKAKYPNDHFVIDKRNWLVSAVTTPSLLSDELNITGGKGGFGLVMVFAIASYSGWHGKNMWDWIALKSTR